MTTDTAAMAKYFLDTAPRCIRAFELYEELFQSQELAAAPPNDDGPPYAVLWGRISELRPNFAWRYVQKLNGLEPPREKEKSD